MDKVALSLFRRVIEHRMYQTFELVIPFWLSGIGVTVGSERVVLNTLNPSKYGDIPEFFPEEDWDRPDDVETKLREICDSLGIHLELQ